MRKCETRLDVEMKYLRTYDVSHILCEYIGHIVSWYLVNIYVVSNVLYLEMTLSSAHDCAKKSSIRIHLYEPKNIVTLISRDIKKENTNFKFYLLNECINSVAIGQVRFRSYMFAKYLFHDMYEVNY